MSDGILCSTAGELDGCSVCDAPTQFRHREYNVPLCPVCVTGDAAVPTHEQWLSLRRDLAQRRKSDRKPHTEH